VKSLVVALATTFSIVMVTDDEADARWQQKLDVASTRTWVTFENVAGALA
jgi:hypothetical protein